MFRTERRRNEKTGATYPWLVRSTAMVNHFYIYCIDREFGPFFLKFCTYFPYTAKLCLNGHEYAKKQLDNKGIGYEALDNGILSCADPKRVQALCDGLSAEKIDGRCPRARLDIVVLGGTGSVSRLSRTAAAQEQQRPSRGIGAARRPRRYPASAGRG